MSQYSVLCSLSQQKCQLERANGKADFILAIRKPPLKTTNRKPCFIHTKSNSFGECSDFLGIKVKIWKTFGIFQLRAHGMEPCSPALETGVQVD